MIEELSKEQLAECDRYVERYTAIGIKTGPIDRDKARIFATKLYRMLDRKEAPKVIFCNGPVESWLTTVYLDQLQQDPAHVPSEDVVIDLVEARKLAQDTTFIWPYLDGQYSTPWVAWIKFMQSIGVQITEDFSIIEDQIEFNIIYPLDRYCIFSERFSGIHIKNKQLHCDGGPAIEYPDGTKCWSLNGISVPQWLAETPWDKLDCTEFPKLVNAEIRREFVKKVGIERLCTQLGTEVIDKVGDYELHVIDLKGTTGKWPYLKMMNPSVGCWHMECVGKECRTVADAIKFRNQSDLTPNQLT